VAGHSSAGWARTNPAGAASIFPRWCRCRKQRGNAIAATAWPRWSLPPGRTTKLL